MSTYLGNPSLSAAVKDRVSTTFEQSVALYKQGRVEEVVAGCGLMLQMDPQFEPARKLLEKARNPMLSIDIDALVPATANEALMEAREAMRVRDFQRVINITTEILTNDLMNDDARILGDEAREKMEAAPFIDQFTRKFEQQMGSGDSAGARATLEKAKSLDPAHPAIQQMESQLFGAQSAVLPSAAFVVDSAPPSPIPGRGAAQATDFGFTFEEQPPAAAGLGDFSFGAEAAPAPPPPAASFSFDAPAPSSGFSFDMPAPGSTVGGGYSFDTPAAPASSGFDFNTPAPGKASNEFDFSSASFETSPEDKQKIDQYLAEGDRSFDIGDYQQAIDIWSRIFLIDVTNDQASERIERAKSKKREIDDRVDSMLEAATMAYDQNDLPAARDQFNSVLRVDPANSTAHDYLERIAERENAGATRERLDAELSAAGAARDSKRDIFADDELDGSFSPLAVPEPAAPSAEKKKAPPKAAAKKSPVGLIAAIVGFVVLVGGGWFVYSKFFAGPDIDPAKTKAIMAEAASLAKRGNYDAAIAKLQEIQTEDPQHDKAISLIADYQAKMAQAAETIDGKPAAAFFTEQLSTGQSAFQAHDFEAAKKAFEQAMRVKPLPPTEKALYDQAVQQTAKLDSAKSLFKERRFADALANLEPLLQQDPQNANIRRMIVDAHFNLGATALQQDRLPEAMAEFDKVLALEPNDELAKRSRDLAARYNGQAKDLLYKIYVKYLPLRQMA